MDVYLLLEILVISLERELLFPHREPVSEHCSFIGLQCYLEVLFLHGCIAMLSRMVSLCSISSSVFTETLKYHDSAFVHVPT